MQDAHSTGCNRAFFFLEISDHDLHKFNLLFLESLEKPLGVFSKQLKYVQPIRCT